MVTSLLRGLMPRAITRDALILEQHIREGRFQRAAALVAGLAALSSGYQVLTEHYRAGFGRQVMYTPVALSPILFLAGVWSAFSARAARTVLPLAALLTLADAVAGFYYHIRNIAERPGGWRIPLVNIVMGPPLFAPILFGLAGYLALVASLLRRWDGSGSPLPPAWLRALPLGIGHDLVTIRQEVREGRFQRHFAAAAGAVGLLSGFEAAYSHDANGFARPTEWVPLATGPLLAAAGAATVAGPSAARRLLPAASALAALSGMAGLYYHLDGIVRRPGGRSTLVHRILYGPPFFAPLLLSAGGAMGIIASLLRRER